MLAIASLNWTQRDIGYGGAPKNTLRLLWLLGDFTGLSHEYFFYNFMTLERHRVTIISDSAQRKTLKLKRALGEETGVIMCDITVYEGGDNTK